MLRLDRETPRSSIDRWDLPLVHPVSHPRDLADLDDPIRRVERHAWDEAIRHAVDDLVHAPATAATHHRVARQLGGRCGTDGDEQLGRRKVATESTFAHDAEGHDVALAIALERQERERDARDHLRSADTDDIDELSRGRWRRDERFRPLSRRACNLPRAGWNSTSQPPHVLKLVPSAS